MTSQLAEKDPEAQMADGSMEGHRTRERRGWK